MIRGVGRAAVATLAAAVLALLPALLRARGPAAATLNLGPNDADYITGFHRDYEIVGPLATRWSSDHAAVDLPVAVERGPAELSFRYARVLPQTARVEVRVAGTVVDRFERRGGRFETRSVPIPVAGTVPASVRFDVDSHDDRGLGVMLDWVRLEVQPGGALRLRGRARWWAPTLILAAFALFRWGGLAPLTALACVSPLAAACALAAARDPFLLAHLGSKLALPALGLTATVTALSRRRPCGAWLPPIFLAGYLLKGAGVFHPAFFYPDVQNHRRYVFALADAEGSLARRGIAAQMAVNTAYPRTIAGRAYAMPYSPLFFVPFTWLPRDGPLVEDALRQVGLAAAALQVPLAFGMASFAFGGGAGAAAALLAALVPVYYSRLLLAVWPTLAGHLLDALTIAAALRLLAAPGEAPRWAALAAATSASLLTYIAALFNVNGFLLWLAALERRLAARCLAVAALATGLTVLWLYHPFVVTLVREILPRALGDQAGSGSEVGAATAGWLAALGRIPLFYGWGYPALAVAGLLLARRRPRPIFHVFAAYGLAFLTLVALRAASGIFKDLKEVEFVAPLVAVLGGASLDALARSGRSGRWAAALVVIGLAAFTIERYARYFADYASAVGAVSP